MWVSNISLSAYNVNQTLQETSSIKVSFSKIDQQGIGRRFLKQFDFQQLFDLFNERFDFQVNFV